MILQYEERGEGPPLVLLHGLFGRRQNLAAIARRLAPTHRVIAMDQRNHGASPHAPGMRYTDMAQDVLETLRAAGADPAIVLGHSMGGKTAMALALMHPASVRALIVADIAPLASAHGNQEVGQALLNLPLPPGLTRRDADAALAAQIPDPAIRGFLLQNLSLTPTPGWRIGLPEIAAGIADLEGWPPELETRRYEGPCLALRGGASNYVTQTGEAKLRAFFPQAESLVLPGAGHWLHAEQPEAFALAISPFLSRINPHQDFSGFRP